MAIVVTMCKLFVTLIIGFVSSKQKILDDHTNKKMSSMITTVISPLLIVSSVAGIEGDPGEVLKLFLAGVVCYIAFPAVAWIAVRLFRVPMKLHGTYMCMIIFSNCAFMGYPVVSALFGNSAIFYATIFNLPFNLMLFSLGMYLIRKDAITAGVEEKKKENSGNRLRTVRQILNNGVIASLLAFLIYFSGIELPAIIADTCRFLGDTCMPLSMLLIGGKIAGSSLTSIFTEKRAYIFSILRLVGMPLFVYLVMQLFSNNKDLIRIATITAGMPIATMVSILSSPYKEQEKAASVAVVLSTLCSMITIPVMCFLLGI